MHRKAEKKKADKAEKLVAKAAGVKAAAEEAARRKAGTNNNRGGKKHRAEHTEGREDAWRKTRKNARLYESLCMQVQEGRGHHTEENKQHSAEKHTQGGGHSAEDHAPQLTKGGARREAAPSRQTRATAPDALAATTIADACQTSPPGFLCGGGWCASAMDGATDAYSAEDVRSKPGGVLTLRGAPVQSDAPVAATEGREQHAEEVWCTRAWDRGS